MKDVDMHAAMKKQTEEPNLTRPSSHGTLIRHAYVLMSVKAPLRRHSLLTLIKQQTRPTMLKHLSSILYVTMWSLFSYRNA